MALGHRQSFHSKLTLINNLLWTSAKPAVLPTAGFQYHACLNTLAMGQLCVRMCVHAHAYVCMYCCRMNLREPASMCECVCGLLYAVCALGILCA